MHIADVSAEPRCCSRGVARFYRWLVPLALQRIPLLESHAAPYRQPAQNPKLAEALEIGLLKAKVRAVLFARLRSDTEKRDLSRITPSCRHSVIQPFLQVVPGNDVALEELIVFY